jgi:hypothetical protein
LSFGARALVSSYATGSTIMHPPNFLGDLAGVATGIGSVASGVANIATPIGSLFQHQSSAQSAPAAAPAAAAAPQSNTTALLFGALALFLIFRR